MAAAVVRDTFRVFSPNSAVFGLVLKKYTARKTEDILFNISSRVFRYLYSSRTLDWTRQACIVRAKTFYHGVVRLKTIHEARRLHAYDSHGSDNGHEGAQEIPHHHHRPQTLATQDCWQCGRSVDVEKEKYFCVCGVVQPPVESRSLFQVMGVAETFDIDVRDLAEKYRNLQRILHPDKYSQKSETERDFSIRHSAVVNKAYNTLLKPLTRGLCILGLHEDVLEKEIQMDPDFLDEIMTRNEEIIEAESLTEMNRLGEQTQVVIDDLVTRISTAFKVTDTVLAKELLFRLKYYANIDDKIKEAVRKYSD